MGVSKGKKANADNVNSMLQLVMKSGKVVLGYKQCLRALREGNAKLVLFSSNCPALRRSEIEYYSLLAKVGVHPYKGDNNEMGSACGKLFRVSCMAVTDTGDSDIVKSFE
ncbi:MAG: hypothetical protein KVP17_002964 [Porospora cf. gigantea B]|uniref:uncharacterized protein n=1 Tax=Porospora cf. gigantea A TaxID=2853593 RepID=UPI003559D4D5|nr:MAG: hypothetical protein KVP18_004117 [Porospora cf. gigantea A]KAH0478001.1 MAG: hypothetical protein KVP17_002964 [Porospora cf. gigantea B]